MQKQEHQMTWTSTAEMFVYSKMMHVFNKHIIDYRLKIWIISNGLSNGVYFIKAISKFILNP